MEIKGTVYKRDDGSFVIDSHFGEKTKHVAFEDNKSLFEDVSKYCLDHPERVEKEPVPIPAQLSELEIRRQRDALLATTDKYLLMDFPGMTKERTSELLVYRQQLRDLPKSKGWPFKVIWPVAPKWVN